jgi:hypothetical protein
MPGPSIAVLLGGKKPEESEPEMGADEDMEDLSPEDKIKHQHASASGLIKSIKDGDSTGVLKAFRALMGLCDPEEEDKAPEEDEGEEEEAPASEE